METAKEAERRRKDGGAGDFRLTNGFARACVDAAAAPANASKRVQRAKKTAAR
ncbi:hypothetical protein [Burkholderia sp. Nafp2/4-1b]|uniref:hypothetical protein n=1 Tax=Burkholderia sp. Nafp2/4-1b TaxID=2116686 RepID=UPI0013CEFF04|nr:hypothetical protein [Burkholderia sp. Nafp2/4-1b]